MSFCFWWLRYTTTTTGCAPWSCRCRRFIPCRRNCGGRCGCLWNGSSRSCRRRDKRFRSLCQTFFVFPSLNILSISFHSNYDYLYKMEPDDVLISSFGRFESHSPERSLDKVRSVRRNQSRRDRQSCADCCADANCCHRLSKCLHPLRQVFYIKGRREKNNTQLVKQSKKKNLEVTN